MNVNDKTLTKSNVIANDNDVKISPELIKNMDNPNKEVAEVWNEKGVDAAVEFMLKDVANGKMTYGEMRSRYG